MSEAFIGEVRIVSFGFAPRGWAFCQGQILPIAQNQALFSILGTTYGGDGKVNFALPDLRGRAPIHFNSAYPLGTKTGEENHTLIATEMPQHNHGVLASSAAAGQALPTGNQWGSLNNGYSNTANTIFAPSALSNTGGGTGHNNMQPYLVLNFIIALVGIYPSRG